MISSCALRPVSAPSTRVDYRQLIDDLCQFLEGKTEKIVSRLKVEMEQAAEELRFEARQPGATRLMPSTGW
jgi:excinuclease UvrABC nuclease subunit